MYSFVQSVHYYTFFYLHLLPYKLINNILLNGILLVNKLAYLHYSMHQQISLIYKRKQTHKTRLIIGISAMLLSIAYYGLYSLLKPTLNRACFETTPEQAGSFQATLSASGVVEPGYKEVYCFCF
jgi:hypothetical protein